MKILKKLGRIYDHIIDSAAVLAGVMLIFLMLSVSLEVALRYFWGRPTSWVGEIAGYILLYIPFLIAAWVLKGEGHVKMDLLLNRLSPKNQCLLNAVTSVTSAVICLVLTWFGLRSSLYFYSVNYKTPTVLMLPKGIIIGIIFVGCFLLSIQFLRQAHRYWKDWALFRLE
jgi:TRAP-type C4-dicarboxylate transport system permease small subunit